jgi:3-phosphoshikimate 1-carboxyvinyltransferase
VKTVRIHPSPALRGTLTVPGDKSISHRAVMLSALSEGKSVLRGLLLGEDVLATIRCFEQMGVRIVRHADRVEVEGVGLHGLKAPAEVLDCGNSGTTLRLMMGILAGQSFISRLTGDASLNRRPVERVALPLRAMGAEIEELRASPAERVVKVAGRPLKGIRYELPMASAQVKSAVLLAGLFAQGETEVVEKVPSRDHTEIMLRERGAAIRKEGGDWKLSPGNALRAMDLTIPGDISSAAFFLVGGLLGKTSSITLRNTGVNPTRTGILEVLKAMGGEVVLKNVQAAGGEAVADLHVSSKDLVATSVGGALIPRLIDELPILAVAMAAAQGTSAVRNAEELRVKESDRIAAIGRELTSFGAKVQAKPDGFAIEGPTVFRAGRFTSGGDHRIAMSLASAATQGPPPSTIEDIACVDTSYQEFFSHLESLGGRCEILP